jgi:hypothetical protein
MGTLLAKPSSGCGKSLPLNGRKAMLPSFGSLLAPSGGSNKTFFTDLERENFQHKAKLGPKSLSELPSDG